MVTQSRQQLRNKLEEPLIKNKQNLLQNQSLLISTLLNLVNGQVIKKFYLIFGKKTKQ
jgi:hypothetical protein